MHHVDDPGTLQAACAACSAAEAIGLDTEFERSTTYYPRPALLQITDGETIWLIDPLAVRDLSALAALLRRPSPVVVMHSAKEDLEVLAIAAGHPPATVFDTQIAAALAGMAPGLGYHALVKELLGVDIAKDQTRSDWLRRPLSAAQQRYAAADVAHLLSLRDLLRERLDALDRGPWLDEEMQRLCQRGEDDPVPKVFDRLSPRLGGDDAARGRLKVLCAWREATARARDRPRRHVVDDDLLLALARAAPQSRAAFEALPEWQDRRARRHVDAASLEEALGKATAAPPLQAPPDLAPHRQALNSMKRAVSEAARALDIDASVLAPRRTLEKALVEVRLRGEPRLPEELSGWRSRYLEEALMECLRT